MMNILSKYRRLPAAFFMLLLLSLFVLPAHAETYDCTAGRHKFNKTRRDAATAEKDGGITYKCDLCGYEYAEVLPAIGHRWGVWVIDKAATCTESGSRYRTCTLHAPHDQTETIPALGHDYVLTETPPTDTQSGVKTYVCKHNGHNYTEPGEPAKGHSYVETITKKPSCFEDGEKTFTCPNDGDAYTEIIPAYGEHDFGEWSVETTSAAGVSGLEARICARDGFKETREISALPAEETTPFKFTALDVVLGGTKRDCWHCSALWWD